MKYILSFLFLAIAGNLSAQLSPKAKITGEWFCQEVIMSKDPLLDSEEAEFASKMMRDLFTGSTFILGADNIFHLKPPAQPTQQWKEMQPMLEGKSWSVDTRTMSVLIGGKENLMEFRVLEDNGTTSFVMRDIPVTLKMKRVK